MNEVLKTYTVNPDGSSKFYFIFEGNRNVRKELTVKTRGEKCYLEGVMGIIPSGFAKSLQQRP